MSVMMKMRCRQTVGRMLAGFWCILAITAISVLWTSSVRAEVPDAVEEKRIYDMAGLLTSEETERFESTIREYRERMKLDLVVVTTENAGGKIARDYADDFYDQGGFGYGKKKNGVLFLIDMDNRELYLSTGGDTIRLLTDARIEKILDDVYEGAEKNNFAASVEVFLEDIDDYYSKGIESGQYNYDIETGRISRYKSIRWYEWLLAVGVSVFVAGSVCMGVKSQYAMKKERKQADNYLMAYRADCGFAYQNQTDHLVNKFVNTTMIPRNQNHSGGGGSFGGGSSPGRSSTHTSSGGRSHGGGGRSF